MKRETPPSELISLSEAGQIVGRSRVTVWRWVQAGRLPSTAIADRIFVRRGDVERIAKSAAGVVVEAADA